ncbi:MAG: hypothetical protein DRO11_08625 [Methanobacteriota archaeon]|nr:MAG: hypothetical protein DRO11_08625 [Euryarchaeota archaeon]
MRAPVIFLVTCLLLPLCHGAVAKIIAGPDGVEDLLLLVGVYQPDHIFFDSLCSDEECVVVTSPVGEYVPEVVSRVRSLHPRRVIIVGGENVVLPRYEEEISEFSEVRRVVDENVCRRWTQVLQLVDLSLVGRKGIILHKIGRVSQTVILDMVSADDLVVLPLDRSSEVVEAVTCLRGFGLHITRVVVSSVGDREKLGELLPGGHRTRFQVFEDGKLVDYKSSKLYKSERRRRISKYLDVKNEKGCVLYDNNGFPVEICKASREQALKLLEILYEIGGDENVRGVRRINVQDLGEKELKSVDYKRRVVHRVMGKAVNSDEIYIDPDVFEYPSFLYPLPILVDSETYLANLLSHEAYHCEHDFATKDGFNDEMKYQYKMVFGAHLDEHSTRRDIKLVSYYVSRKAEAKAYVAGYMGAIKYNVELEDDFERLIPGFKGMSDAMRRKKLEELFLEEYDALGVMQFGEKYRKLVNRE